MKNGGAFNGTRKSVAGFFNIDERTLDVWTTGIDPKTGARTTKMIECWRKGRFLVYGEQHVTACWVKYDEAARGMTATDAVKLAEQKWRDYLGIFDQRRATETRVGQQAWEINELKRRLAALEKVYHISQEAA